MEINQGKDENSNNEGNGHCKGKNISGCVCSKCWRPGGPPEVQIYSNVLSVHAPDKLVRESVFPCILSLIEPG